MLNKMDSKKSASFSESNLICSGFDIFSKPEYIGDFEHFSDVIIQPLHPPQDTNNCVYQFKIGGYEDTLWTYPSSIKVCGRARILYEDNSELLKDDAITVVNQFPKSLVEHVNVYLNNVPISDHGRGYAIKAHLLLNYNYSQNVKASNLIADYWRTSDEEIDVKLKLPLNTVLTERQTFIKKSTSDGSKDVFFCYTPPLDIISMERYLPPGNLLQLDFERAPVNYSILSTSEKRYKIRIYEFYLIVRRFKMPAMNKMEQRLASDTQYYPFTRTQLRYRQIHAGIIDITISQIFQGFLPYHILVAIVDNNQLSSASYNPFVLHHHNLSRYSLIQDGYTVPPDPIKIDTSNNNVIRAYKYFLENCGVGIQNSELGISPFSYLHKDFVLMFDLSGDSCLGAHNHLTRSGTIDLQLSFTGPTDNPLTIIILGTFESVLTIGQHKEVLLDYSL